MLPEEEWLTVASGKGCKYLKGCGERNGFHFFGFRNNIFFFQSVMSSALRPAPNLEDYVPAFTSPSDRMTQLYPFYHSQGYRGGILTRLRTPSASCHWQGDIFFFF
jgi:hypothetical protein